jgi:hypothetical protein
MQDNRKSHKTEALFDKSNTVFFTICSWNYLAYALTLRESLIQSNGFVNFYAAICDAGDRFDHLSLPFPVILLDDLGIPSLDEMKHRYNITELNTAIKPFVFSYLFEKHPDSVVIYMDPDILVASELNELQSALMEGADCVLTPHILEPNEFASFDDRQMLLYGICNLGFCALRSTPTVQRVVSWWGRRLEQHCVIDLANGLFVDQKWADLLPAFIEKTRLLHHCGYNVAYWNLSQRRVWHTENGWTVNSQSLKFFHFSGNRIGGSTIFSRHSRDFGLSIGDVEGLFESYVKQVEFNGHNYYRSIPYGYSWNGESGMNLHTPHEQTSQKTFSGLDFSNGKGRIVPHIPILRTRSLSEYLSFKTPLQETIKFRKQIEAGLAPAAESDFTLQGHCVVCGKPSTFQGSYQYSVNYLQDRRCEPNWREHLNCLSCGFINRIRGFLHIFFQEGVPSKDDPVYITEQATPTYSWLSQKFPNLVGSEYMDDTLAPGSVVDKVRHEDIQSLSFSDNCFKFILSLDVLEYVPNYSKALQEVYRCLKPGGMFLVSVPFCIDTQKNQIMATMGKDKSIVHLQTPEHHKNPVNSENGSLCFRYFGWELVDDLLKAGFEAAECWSYWSRQNVYLGEPQILIAARKPL